jgi:long-chain acyl-CoA synthetase
MELAKENGIEGNGLEDLIHDKKLNGLVLKEMQQVGRDGGLAGIEIIDGVVMADEEWNTVNVSAHRTLAIMVVTDKLQGLTTAAQKINRRGILAKYQKEVDKLYADGN